MFAVGCSVVAEMISPVVVVEAACSPMVQDSGFQTQPMQLGWVEVSCLIKMEIPYEVTVRRIPDAQSN